MNERIRELAEQASLYAFSQLTHEKFTRLQEVFEQKFAELIVRQCAELVVDDDNAFDILKHFGVEK